LYNKDGCTRKPVVQQSRLYDKACIKNLDPRCSDKCPVLERDNYNSYETHMRFAVREGHAFPISFQCSGGGHAVRHSSPVFCVSFHCDGGSHAALRTSPDFCESFQCSCARAVRPSTVNGRPTTVDPAAVRRSTVDGRRSTAKPIVGKSRLPVVQQSRLC
jgi:hypothetical protein